MHPFDLVILDLDGTILDPYQHTGISAPVQAALRAVQDAGIPVTIATGRTLDFVVEHIAPLGIRTPVVTTQGAVLGDPVRGRALAETRLPAAGAQALAQWADATQRVSAFFFTEDGHTRIYQNLALRDTAFYDHAMGTPRQVVGPLLPLLARYSDQQPLKYLMISDVAVEPELPAVLAARFGPTMSMARTHPLLVEATAAGVDKGAGVRDLCHLLGIDLQRVLAIGDNENDIPMLQIVGCAVAMGNAAPAVKAVAHWVAPSIHEDGAAVALRRLVLGEV